MTRSKQYDREDVIRAAKELFWKRGFGGTSTRDVTARAKLARKSLYTEFSSKAGLFRVAVAAYIAGEGRFYRELLGAEPKGLRNLERYFGGMDFGGRFRGCLLVNSLAARDSLPPQAARVIDRFFEDAFVLFRENVAAAQRAGEIRLDVEAGAVAQLLLTFDQGVAVSGKSPAARRRLRTAIEALLESLRA